MVCSRAQCVDVDSGNFFKLFGAIYRRAVVAVP